MSRTAKHGFEWIRQRSKTRLGKMSKDARESGSVCECVYLHSNAAEREKILMKILLLRERNSNGFGSAPANSNGFGSAPANSNGFGSARASPPPGDAKARCVLCSSWAKVRPSRIMFRLECVFMGQGEHLLRRATPRRDVCYAVHGPRCDFTDYVQIRMCEIAARAPPAEQCVQCVAYWRMGNRRQCLYFLSLCVFVDLLTY